jgi:hypothetical protein
LPFFVLPFILPHKARAVKKDFAYFLFCGFFRFLKKAEQKLFICFYGVLA